MSQADNLRREMALALGREVLSKKRVYLDTCYWVRLREHAAGRNSDPHLAELAEQLEYLVARGQVICPIEGTGLMEWMRQTDPETRSASLSLMERLSQNVCLVQPRSRTYLEACYLLYRNRGGVWEGAPEPKELVWTRPFAVFGLVEGDSPLWSQDARDFIQVGVERQLWGVTLQQAFGRAAAMPAELLPRTARDPAAINEGIRSHAHQLHSFTRTLAMETAGGLDAERDVLTAAWRYCFHLEGGDPATVTEEELVTSVRELIGLLAAMAAKGRLGSLIPSVAIPSALHASLRWDKQRQLGPTDLEDFAHAAAALPYCDLFLTDRGLAAMLTAPHLQLDLRFGARVAARPEDAIAALREVLT